MSTSNFTTIDVIAEFANATVEQSPFALINENDGHDYYNTGSKVLMDWTDNSNTDVIERLAADGWFDCDVLGEIDDQMPTEPVPTQEQVVRSREWTNKLNDLLDLDNRLGKGLVLINSATREKDEALATYIDSKETFKALMARLNLHQDRWNDLSYEAKQAYDTTWSVWKSALWAEANPVKDARNESYEKFQGMKDTVSKYWDLWKQLRDKSHALATENNLWGAFFTLKNFEFSTYWCNPNPQDTTDLLDTVEAAMDRVEEHEMQLFEYTHDDEVDVDWSFQDNRKDVRTLVENMTVETRKEVLASRPF